MRVSEEGLPCRAANRGRSPQARMAELVDALVSGISGRKVVGVRVPFRAVLVLECAAVKYQGGLVTTEKSRIVFALRE